MVAVIWLLLPQLCCLVVLVTVVIVIFASLIVNVVISVVACFHRAVGSVVVAVLLYVVAFWLPILRTPQDSSLTFCVFGFTSGKKKQHKHKLFGPDFPRTFLTLTPGCPGVKKFLPTTGAAGKRTFWCGHPRFSARTSMTRRVVEKLCAKKVCVDFLAPIT